MEFREIVKKTNQTELVINSCEKENVGLTLLGRLKIGDLASPLI